MQVSSDVRELLLWMQLPASLRSSFSFFETSQSFKEAYASLSSLNTPEHARVVAKQCVVLERMGIVVVPCWEYPAWLRGVRPWAPALFVRGDVSVLGRRGLAVVGSREASEGPLAWARGVAGRYARGGGLVVSGGARGIDAAAHEACMEHGGVTVAYVGVACDRVYPASHVGLFARMLAGGGALVSEHPPGAVTYASAHAMRNRFIAAHGSGLAIAEAREKSGTLGTARWALKVGTPIVVPPDAVGGERGGIALLLASEGVRVWSLGEGLEGL